MSARRGQPRPPTATSGGQRQTPKLASIRFRIVIHAISDDEERLLADYTVDRYVAAIGRRLPTRQVEHNTLLGGPLDRTIGLAGIIPDAMAGFIDRHLGGR